MIFICVNLQQEPLTLQAIASIKEGKKRRKKLGIVFGIIYRSLTEKLVTTNMVLSHNEYCDLLENEITLIGKPFGIDSRICGELSSVFLWKMYRTGMISYVDLDEYLFLTLKSNGTGIVEKILNILGKVEISEKELFEKLEIPYLYYSNYETCVKHMIKYSRVTRVNNLISRVILS